MEMKRTEIMSLYHPHPSLPRRRGRRLSGLPDRDELAFQKT
jgi:hypothetical protein